MILRNARCIFPDGIREGCEVVVHDGKIAELRHGHPARGPSNRKPKSQDSVDLGGNYLAPGFVDLHVHGAAGHDTMGASESAFRAICGYHASGGTTSLLLTTATAPVHAIIDVLKAVRACASIRQVAGVHIEGPFISKLKPGAQRAEFIRDPDSRIVEQLLTHRDVIKRITIAPELPGALDVVEKFFARDISVSGGHSDAWDEQARAAFERGMRSVTHTFNCMSSARRRGIERVAGLLEFALSEPGIICELIADGHHVSTTLMKMLYRAKGPAGICVVTDATAGAGLQDGSHFSLSGADCVIRDGVCLLADGSALAGSAARMIDLVRVLVRDVAVPLHEAIAMATENPASAVGLAAKGRLVVGADADFAVISPELEVMQTFVAGNRIFSK